jgi:hypothetical protein
MQVHANNVLDFVRLAASMFGLFLRRARLNLFPSDALLGVL